MATNQNFNLPRKLATRGLTEYHRHPLAADLKDKSGQIFPTRMSPREAWEKAYIELNPPNSWAVMVLDCDDPEWILGMAGYSVPKPSYSIQNIENDHWQFGWILKNPVHRNSSSSLKAQKRFAGVNAKLGYVLKADPAYNGILARNPAYRHEGVNVGWGTYRQKGYTLDELDLDLPDVNISARDINESSAVGRNVAVFEQLMIFAGSPKNAEVDLHAEAERMNSQLATPLPWNEVRDIAKSVERYRRDWIRKGRYGRSAAYQRESQIKSVEARLNKSHDRDAAIFVGRIVLEKSPTQLARELGINRTTVYRILNSSERLERVRGEFNTPEERQELQRFEESKTTVQDGR
jgi:hypothetical protein